MDEQVEQVEHVSASHCKQVSELVLEGVKNNGVELAQIKKLLNPKMEKLDKMHTWFVAVQVVLAATLSGGGIYGAVKIIAYFVKL